MEKTKQLMFLLLSPFLDSTVGKSESVTVFNLLQTGAHLIHFVLHVFEQSSIG